GAPAAYLHVDAGHEVRPAAAVARRRACLGSFLHPVRLAMLRIDVTTLISRPVQEVWDYFIDLRNSPHWTRSGSELRPTSEGPFAIGTVVESVRTVFGREVKPPALVTRDYDARHVES